MASAMIFGITGQDGFWLSKLLLSKGYTVYGVARRTSTDNLGRLAETRANPKFSLLAGDVTDYSSVSRLINDYVPEEVYNLAAQSHVKISFDEPFHTTSVVYNGCLNILESIREIQKTMQYCSMQQIKFYQASSSEMFGSSYSNYNYLNPKYNGHIPYHLLFTTDESKDIYLTKKMQNEQTPYLPCSPYAIAKLAAHHAVGVYRSAYGLHASSGILFNHESEHRGEAFVTRKITKYVASLKKGNQKFKLELGNLDAKRDWGHAEDYVEAMWLMLQQPSPADYVIATGETHSVREFLEEAFACIGEKPDKYVSINKSFCRPNEVDYLCGDASKAATAFGWKPKVSFKELVRRMVEHDINDSRI